MTIGRFHASKVCRCCTRRVRHLRIGAVNLGESRCGELVKAQVKFFILASVDPCSGHGLDGHSIADEEDDIRGLILVFRVVEFITKGLLAATQPVACLQFQFINVQLGFREGLSASVLLICEIYDILIRGK